MLAKSATCAVVAFCFVVHEYPFYSMHVVRAELPNSNLELFSNLMPLLGPPVSADLRILFI
jgi:hypothetical protein